MAKTKLSKNTEESILSYLIVYATMITCCWCMAKSLKYAPKIDCMNDSNNHELLS